ncbi:cyanate hydratase [Alteromonas macleodii]
MITSRTQVTDMIQSAKILKGIKWSQIAEVVGQSKEWSTAACLGQMAMTKQQAEAVGELLELTDEAIAWLQIVPYK